MSELVAKTAVVLSDLVVKIKAEHQDVVTATGNVVVHAVKAGELLLSAKQNFDHGGWLTWLKDQCALEERTAQRYMRLAKNKDKLNAFANPSRLSDLSLSQAYALLAADPKPKDNKTPNETKVSDRYDKIAEKLIGSLKKMGADEAEAAATETIRQIKDVVSIKRGGTLKKAA